ncbi:SRPBCC family protein [Sphingomonas sp.]|uniref:SRPBCC family protein n=1 Tax=Sphingomonas sp. TaxID=28214 RepID=UPI0025F18393|nr:SRPBCC family protein [Sphingomonas sp.]
MTELATTQQYGVLTEPATLTIERLLPGSIDRVWAYLTESDLRRQWLASGTMDMRVGAPFELTWRNNQLMDNPGRAPEGFTGEHQMQSEITELRPPHRIGFTFGTAGEVTFDLEPVGDMVRLTLVHRRLPDRTTMLKVSAGWHAHVDVLAARLTGEEPLPFWDNWTALRAEYERRLPA